MLKKWIEAALMIKDAAKRKTLMENDVNQALLMGRKLTFNVPVALYYRNQYFNDLDFKVTKTGGAQQEFPISEVKKFVNQSIQPRVTVRKENYYRIRTGMYKFVTLVISEAFQYGIITFDENNILSAINRVFEKHKKGTTQTESLNEKYKPESEK